MPSVPLSHLYRSLHTYLMQQIPDDCDTRLANLIYLMMGIFRAEEVQLPLVARTIPIRADKWSIVKRLERFLNNPAVEVQVEYRLFGEPLLKSAASAMDLPQYSRHRSCLLVK